jgi:DNA (cytosine-5)-methyltransferase 1
MSLYAQIVFLKTYHKGLWCVENVIPYYTPLIAPTARVGRHLVWANFPIGDLILPPQGIRDRNAIADFAAHELVKGSLIRNKRQALRNLCDPRVGRHIYNAALAAKEGTRHGQE